MIIEFAGALLRATHSASFIKNFGWQGCLDWEVPELSLPGFVFAFTHPPNTACRGSDPWGQIQASEAFLCSSPAVRTSCDPSHALPSLPHSLRNKALFPTSKEKLAVPLPAIIELRPPVPGAPQTCDINTHQYVSVQFLVLGYVYVGLNCGPVLFM